ncbi:MAG: glycosyltransferase 87 family protein [Christensenellales bacterium]
MRRYIFFAVALPAAITLFMTTAYAANTFSPSQATEQQTALITVFTIITAAVFALVCLLLLMRAGGDGGGRVWPALALAVALAVALRVFTALIFKGHETDVRCFTIWAETVYKTGPEQFYTHGIFSDYPPGYMYVLWLLGFIRDLFSLDINSAINILLIKLPSIAAEVITAVIVYKAASKQTGKMFGLLCASFLLFNPAMFFNSSAWGQIDAFFILFAVLALYYARKENPYLTALYFAVSLLLKPHALMVAPVIGLYYLYSLFRKGRFGRAALGALGGAAVFTAVFAAGVLPFTGSQPITWIAHKYAGTVASYNYATINAFNLFALTGGNWVDSGEALWLNLPYATWGWFFIGLAVLAVIILQWRSREYGRTFELAAFLIISVFMLAHSMHERYMLPACVFLFFGYVYTRERGTLLFAAAFSFTSLLNQTVTLFAETTAAPQNSAYIIAAVNIVLFLIFVPYMSRRLLSGRVLIKPPALNG